MRWVKITLIVVLGLAITAFIIFKNLTLREKPIVVKMQNVKVLKANLRHILISAEAIIVNKNDVGGTLKARNLKVFIDDHYVADVTTQIFEAPPRKQFVVPLTAKIVVKDVVNKDVIKAIIKARKNKIIKIRFKGDIDIKFLGYTYTHKVNVVRYRKLKRKNAK